MSHLPGWQGIPVGHSSAYISIEVRWAGFQFDLILIIQVKFVQVNAFLIHVLNIIVEEFHEFQVGLANRAALLFIPTKCVGFVDHFLGKVC